MPMIGLIRSSSLLVVEEKVVEENRVEEKVVKKEDLEEDINKFIY